VVALINFKNWYTLVASSIWQSIKRFPVVYCLIVSTMLLIKVYFYGSGLMKDFPLLIAMCVALWIPIFLCVKLILEINRINQKSLKIIFHLVGFVLSWTCFLIVPNSVRYIVANITLYLIFILLLYINQKDSFELHVAHLINRFLISIFYALILFLVVSTFLFTIKFLFSDGSDYVRAEIFDLSLFIFGIFAPSCFLAGLPNINEDKQSEEYPKILKIVLIYYLIPAIVIYTGALYLYYIKILLTFEWPNEILGHLILWYSIISAGVIFLVFPLQNDFPWIKTFIKWFTKLLIPSLIIMLVSTAFRIYYYGVTENCYYLLVSGLFVLGVVLYWNLAKTIRNIVLPVFLVIVMNLSVCLYDFICLLTRE
jgi:hypothetical protein